MASPGVVPRDDRAPRRKARAIVRGVPQRKSKSLRALPDSRRQSTARRRHLRRSPPRLGSAEHLWWRIRQPAADCGARPHAVSVAFAATRRL